MNNSLTELNEIIQPYFKKKQEIEDRKTKREEEKKSAKEELSNWEKIRKTSASNLRKSLKELQLRRERRISNFKEKKAGEIEDYISNWHTANPYNNDEDIVRKELEALYDERLKEIEEEFDSQEKKIKDALAVVKEPLEVEKILKSKIESLENGLDYTNVDLREMAETKWELRKPLIAFRSRVALELSKEKIKFDSCMVEMSEFKYTYDSEGRVTNGDEYRALYNKSNEISTRMNELRETLRMVDEYLDQMQATEEESKAVMRGMAPWEKEEYDRRRAANAEQETEIVEKEEDSVVEDEEDPVVEDLKEDSEKKEPVVDDTTENEDDFVKIHDSIDVPEFKVKGNVIKVNSELDFLKLIYMDIIQSINGLDTIRLNPKRNELMDSEYYISTKEGIDPQDDSSFKRAGSTLSWGDSINKPYAIYGDYISQEEFLKALDKYVEKRKGITYKVKRKNVVLDSKTIEKFKARLKKCCALKLIRDNKITESDIVRIYGRSTSESEFGEEVLASVENIGIEEGEYINKCELVSNLDLLFTRKKLAWLKQLREKLKGFKSGKRKTSTETEVEEEVKTK